MLYGGNALDFARDLSEVGYGRSGGQADLCLFGGVSLKIRCQIVTRCVATGQRPFAHLHPTPLQAQLFSIIINHEEFASCFDFVIIGVDLGHADRVLADGLWIAGPPNLSGCLSALP